MGIDCSYSCCSSVSLEVWNEVEIIIFNFERHIRAEVVTYRLDVAFGSLHMKQLHDFDELRNDQEAI
jgi:hypothetical protein